MAMLGWPCAASQRRLDERNAFDAPSSDTRRLEHDLEPGKLGMRCEPGVRRRLHAPRLLRSDHLERVAELVSTLLLHLDHDYAASSAHDEIKLVATRTHVRGEQAVAAKPVVAKRAALAAVHAASQLETS